MSSSSPQTTTRTTGAHRAHREARDRGAARTVAQRPPTPHDPYLDGLFTYCLSVLCDHDAATAALGDALVLAERRHHRCPEAAADRRAWLYALARWACLRKLSEAQQKRQAAHAAGREAPTEAPPAPAVPEDVQEHRRRELALLAWPEAAGTTPEQREALELAVRHHLAAHEVAAVLGTAPAAARELLASAACEVERTRAALAVVDTGTCPGVARFAAGAGDDRPVLSAALRRELVRHVDDCPRCRRTAERAIPGRWPGTSVTPAALPVLTAPRAALHMTMAHLPRPRGAAPRFDRRGFPMPPGDRAARRDRLRARAVVTTVVATVVAAPAFALWAACRGTPATGTEDGRATSASETHDTDGTDDGTAADGYEHTGSTGTAPAGDLRVSVKVLGAVDREDAARMEVTAARSGGSTLITLTATGRSPVRWSASTGAPWLYLNRSSGTLAPGTSTTVTVHVDQLREPSGHWSARVAVTPGGAVVSIEGYGTAPGPSRPGPRPGPPGTPATPPPADPRPTATVPPPAEPTPTATPTPTPPDPTPADPSPTGTGGPQAPSDGDGTPSPAAP
ncbi:BACON domain-containing protein [Streptomyces sp. enrichment culture]|uniref:BACON domain-containing protein n=1 Tax=Streptomyces sp. enrichment culture TaxID=1795815 RepID=UPI003F5516D1